LSYEQSPVTLAYRSARLPDSNRYWLAFGAKYKVNKNLSIDGAYAHLFVKKAPIAQTGSISRTLNGNYKSSADIVGVQLTWNFV
jgi:long-chain fatty acid transport protein